MVVGSRKLKVQLTLNNEEEREPLFFLKIQERKDVRGGWCNLIF
jgi:hypothetical protein